jgi:hypothetical protein
VHSEYFVNEADRIAPPIIHKETIDIVYSHDNNRRFCFELKQIRIEDLKIGAVNSGKPGNLKQMSDNISNMSDVRAVFALQLQPKEHFIQQKATWIVENYGSTVREYLDNVIKNQIIGKYKDKLQKDDSKNGKSIAWVVCRIGLGKVVHLPAFQ